MKKTLLTLLLTTSAFYIADVNAAEHPPGHGSANRAASSGNCTKPRLEKFLPPNMATVAPGSEFSFVAFIDKPEQLIVTAKKIPVEIKAEFKDPFYVVTGKLPDGLRNTVARITIKVDSKSAACESEKGWLVKISE